MKNLDELFNQIKFSTILTTGRTGSDFLQGCLDNVPWKKVVGRRTFESLS